MLVQSHTGVVQLLPALPPAGPSGEVRGLRARRGFTLDIAWANGALVEATVTSHLGLPCRLSAALPFTVHHKDQVIAQTRAEIPAEFATQPGAAYRVLPVP
jgi:alpha-L-fucosidase 2